MLCRLLVAFPPSQRSFPLACESARRLSSVAYTREDHELHMRTALQQAGKAFSEGEVPIGAVLIIDQTVVAEAHNRVEGHCDASAHAEILCMRSAGDKVGSWRMRNAVSLAKRIRTPMCYSHPCSFRLQTLYCTVEPCPMCAAAIQAFRIERVVYGASNPRLGAFESGTAPLNPYAPPLDVVSGVLANESSELMKNFFRSARQRKSYSETKANQKLSSSYIVTHRLKAAVRRLTAWAWL